MCVGSVLSLRIRDENVCRCISPFVHVTATWATTARESHRCRPGPGSKPGRVYAPRYQRQGHVSSAEYLRAWQMGPFYSFRCRLASTSRGRMLNFCRKPFPCRRFIPPRPSIEPTRPSSLSLPLSLSSSAVYSKSAAFAVDEHLRVRDAARKRKFRRDLLAKRIDALAGEIIVTTYICYNIIDDTYCCVSVIVTQLE